MTIFCNQSAERRQLTKWLMREREKESKYEAHTENNNSNNRHDSSKQERNLVSACERYTVPILDWFELKKTRQTECEQLSRRDIHTNRIEQNSTEPNKH